MQRKHHKVIVAVCCVAGLTILLSAAFRVHQYHLRSRASDIIVEMQKVKTGASACQELAAVRSRWPTELKTQGSCERGEFFMTVSFNFHSLPLSLLGGIYDHPHAAALRRVLDAYQALAGRYFEVSAEIVAKDGAVRSTTTLFRQVVPTRDRDKFIGSIQQVAVIERATRDIRLPKEPLDQYQQAVHPTYRVFRDMGITNLDTGGPLYDVRNLGVEIRSNATEAEVNHLFSFDLSCLTRFISCNERDFMPVVYDQFETDSRAQRAAVQ
jgi:hypothetical protein